MGAGTENILRKVGTLVCFEMCSEIILGRVTNTLNLMKALRLSDMPG